MRGKCISLYFTEDVREFVIDRGDRREVNGFGRGGSRSRDGLRRGSFEGKGIRARKPDSSHESSCTNDTDVRGSWCRGQSLFWQRRSAQRRGWWNIVLGPERESVSRPVNQRIVLGQPIMSKDHRTRGIQLGDIAGYSHRFTGRKSKRKVYTFSNIRIGGTVKKPQLNGRNRICR